MLSFLMISSLFSLAPAQAVDDDLQLENWSVFRVGPSGSILEPSAVMGTDGTVHLVYLNRDTAYTDWYLRPNYLRYAELSGGEWNHTDLRSGFFSFADIALDDDGHAHILCAMRWNDTVDLVYWNNANGTWVSENVAQFDTDDARNVDLAVDQEGKVHAVFGIGDVSDENITYQYVTNARGNWTFVPFYSVAYWVGLNCLPDLEIDSSGRAHIAYVTVNDFVYGGWDSGEWAIELMTWDGGDWTDVKNISLPSRCNSLSLQLDEGGYEHILYHYVTSSAEFPGPVVLAQWNASGLSWGGIADGTWLCELHLDQEGNERFMFMHEDNYFFVGDHRTGGQDSSVRVPAGTYPASRDPGALSEQGAVILLFDSLSEELLLYMPGSVSSYPEIVGLEMTDDGVRLEWDAVASDVNVSEYHVYRAAISGEVVPLTIDIRPFVVPANETRMTDDTLGDIPEWSLLHYRISVITDQGEEYIGEMSTLYINNDGEEGLDTSGFMLIVAAIAIVVLAVIVVILLVIRNKK